MQTVYALVCIVLATLGIVWQFPQTKLALIQLRALRTEGGPSMSLRWKDVQPLVVISACVLLLGFGVLLFLYPRKTRPSESAATATLTAVPANQQKDDRSATNGQNTTATKTTPPKQQAVQGQPTKPKSDPCPNGYTILENSTAVRSPWDHAKTTGFNINGANPCLKISGTRSIDNTTGYKFSNEPEKAAPTYEQKCDNGSPCAQGQGSTATVNNYAPPERHLTPAQKSGIAQLVADNPLECRFDFEYVDNGETQAYAREIHDAFVSTPPGKDFIIPLGVHRKGVYVQVASREDICAPSVLKVANALQDLGIPILGAELGQDVPIKTVRIFIGEQ
jgi:hypothetical protein